MILEAFQDHMFEVLAYVAFALIGAILLCSNGWCNGDESDENEAPQEMYS